MHLRRTLPAATLLIVLTALAASALAGTKPKRQSVRSEITALKARIAQLEGQAGFLMRRQGAPGGSGTVVPGGAPGGLCADPCATDSDADGLGDCADPCPCDPSTTDRDADGALDCADPCPDDASNACAAPCPWGDDALGRPCVLPPTDGCHVGGCSGQLCIDAGDNGVSTCEWQESYACYRQASCERQPDGHCAWTPTESLAACLAKAPSE